MRRLVLEFVVFGYWRVERRALPRTEINQIPAAVLSASPVFLIDH